MTPGRVCQMNWEDGRFWPTSGTSEFRVSEPGLGEQGPNQTEKHGKLTDLQETCRFLNIQDPGGKSRALCLCSHPAHRFPTFPGNSGLGFLKEKGDSPASQVCFPDSQDPGK